MLHRALHHVHYSEGFWIDVGGFSPYHDSVTKHFYEHGWHGVNIEPSVQLFPAFVEQRPGDVNLQVAVTDHEGEATFHEIEHGQLGTLEDRFADRHAEQGLQRRSYTVPATTLTRICEQHAPKEIHFLKVDVEGHEAAVLRGMDFNRFRPWVMVIEAVEPNRMDRPTYEEWDPGVQSAGYDFVYTDILNRYYIAQEHRELARYFSLPADDYIYHYLVRERDAALGERDEALRRLKDLEALVSSRSRQPPTNYAREGEVNKNSERGGLGSVRWPLLRSKSAGTRKN